MAAPSGCNCFPKGLLIYEQMRKENEAGSEARGTENDVHSHFASGLRKDQKRGLTPGEGRTAFIQPSIRNETGKLSHKSLLLWYDKLRQLIYFLSLTNVIGCIAEHIH